MEIVPTAIGLLLTVGPVVGLGFVIWNMIRDVSRPMNARDAEQEHRRLLSQCQGDGAYYGGGALNSGGEGGAGGDSGGGDGGGS